MDNRPIGVFDSGLGGLTVFSEIIKLLKNESLVYFGDSGRAPYGTKSKTTILKYTFQDINFLLNQDVKMIVIACNTASACSLSQIRNTFSCPIVEVIEPGAIAAVRETKNKKIGVIGTTATIESGVYEHAITKIDAEIKIFKKACPMLVPLVEEGWWENDVANMVVEKYISSFKQDNIDTLVLGCTHYPLLFKTISKVLGNDVKLVSSALEIAKVVKNFLIENDIERDEQISPVYRFYSSDSVEKFEALAKVILNQEINTAQRVDIEKY